MTEPFVLQKLSERSYWVEVGVFATLVYVGEGPRAPAHDRDRRLTETSAPVPTFSSSSGTTATSGRQ